MMNICDIIDYENGELSWEEEVEFFQKLIDDGSVWGLQGTYGRRARALIEHGDCHGGIGSCASMTIT